MKLHYVPLLHLQRDLYRLPRGMERFRQYLRTMVKPDGQDLELPPLVAMNPMAKDHVPALLDEYLAIDADGVAARAIAEALPRVAEVPGEFKIGLVLADDLKGGWTNRYASEYSLISPSRIARKYDWLTGVLWSSEPATAETAAEAVLTTVYRTAYVHQHGKANSLREIMAQEGYVMAMAGYDQPMLDADDLEYTREVLVPYLGATDMRTCIECLYGDAAGKTLGFTPRGLSHRAGLALALNDARTKLLPITVGHSCLP